jgi:hypothetical protein
MPCAADISLGVNLSARSDRGSSRWRSLPNHRAVAGRGENIPALGENKIFGSVLRSGNDQNPAMGNRSNFAGIIVAYLAFNYVASVGIIMNKGRYGEAHEHRETSSRGLNYYLLAGQPLILQPRHGEIKGEYVLADAVLREAIREYQKFARYQSRRGVKLFRDVDQWFLADDRDSCFSFINICQVLDLEPTYIRTGLNMWRERVAPHDGHFDG